MIMIGIVKVKFISNICFFVLFTSILLGCNLNTNLNYENEVSEKEDAESVVSKLYWYTNNNELTKIPDLFGKSFYKTSDVTGLLNFLNDKKNTFGNFKGYNLISWKTNRTEGSNPISQYLLIYSVKYSNGETVEEISLIKEDNQIMISGYRVNKDLEK